MAEPVGGLAAESVAAAAAASDIGLAGMRASLKTLVAERHDCWKCLLPCQHGHGEMCTSAQILTAAVQKSLVYLAPFERSLRDQYNDPKTQPENPCRSQPP